MRCRISNRQTERRKWPNRCVWWSWSHMYSPWYIYQAESSTLLSVYDIHFHGGSLPFSKVEWCVSGCIISHVGLKYFLLLGLFIFLMFIKHFAYCSLKFVWAVFCAYSKVIWKQEHTYLFIYLYIYVLFIFSSYYTCLLYLPTFVHCLYFIYVKYLFIFISSLK